MLNRETMSAGYQGIARRVSRPAAEHGSEGHLNVVQGCPWASCRRIGVGPEAHRVGA
jgi:hypothetical protein